MARGEANEPGHQYGRGEPAEKEEKRQQWDDAMLHGSSGRTSAQDLLLRASPVFQELFVPSIFAESSCFMCNKTDNKT